MDIKTAFVDFNLPDTVPYVNGIRFKNTVQKWFGTDSQERFLSNLQDKKSNSLLRSLSWDTADITYSFNSNGFRDQEFDNRECGIAIGCSFTLGVGLPLNATWPYMLSQYTGIHVWNLASGGASIGTVFRIFEHYFVKFKPKFVCILMPPSSRFEFKDHNNNFSIIQPLVPGTHVLFAKDWLSQEFNGIIDRKKTMLAIDNICKHFNVPLVFNDSDSQNNFDQFRASNDLARDLMHGGVKYQKYQAEYMFNKLKGISNDCTKK
jgi:hypothetical protein